MPRIYNVGSLNIDEVFRVREFVRPGETLSAIDYAVFPGGKGCNQSIALARAGASVSHAGMIGSDGRFLIDLLRESGADASSIFESPIPTGRALIQVRADGQNSILLYGGANRAIEDEDMDGMLSAAAPGDWLLLQNEISGNERAMRLARERSMRIFLNPSPIDDALARLPLELVDCLILNEIEGEALSGEAGIEPMLGHLSRRLPKADIVLTLGGEGVAYRARGGASTLRLSARRVPAVDTTAAGDTFTGYYIAARARGLEAEPALAEATEAAALCVTRRGAASSIPWKAELAQAR